jgi:hypothetical protein
MLLSSSFLNSSYSRFKKNREKNNKIKEGYNMRDSSLAGISASFDSFLLIVAVLFFVLEFFLLFYALNIALRCTNAGPERVVHITLAIIFTLPYVLFSVFFSKCANSVLKNSDIFMTPLNEYSSSNSEMKSGFSFL